MPIVMKYSPVGAIGLGAAAAGKNKYNQRAAETYMPLVQKQIEQRFEQQMAEQQHKYQLGEISHAAEEEGFLQQAGFTHEAGMQTTEHGFRGGESRLDRRHEEGLQQGEHGFRRGESRLDRRHEEGLQQGEFRERRQEGRRERRHEGKMTREEWEREERMRDEERRYGESQELKPYLSERQDQKLSQIDAEMADLEDDANFSSAQKQQAYAELQKKRDKILGQGRSRVAEDMERRRSGEAAGVRTGEAQALQAEQEVGTAPLSSYQMSVMRANIVKELGEDFSPMDVGKALVDVGAAVDLTILPPKHAILVHRRLPPGTWYLNVHGQVLRKQ